MSDDVQFLTERERKSHPQKFAALTAIAAHLAQHGPRNWKLVLEQFKDVPEPTMWRWIREAKRLNTPETQPAIKKAAKKAVRKLADATIDRHEEAKTAGVERIAQNLPAAPSPAYLARTGSAGMDNLDFAVEIRTLYRDAEMLRAYAVAQEEGKPERIKNPHVFEKSIARRTNILETGIRTLQELWDLRTMQAFYEAVIAEIQVESPECAERILRRLADLNSRTGMTMSMRL